MPDDYASTVTITESMDALPRWPASLVVAAGDWPDC
jgi:hypothetical protein